MTVALLPSHLFLWQIHTQRHACLSIISPSIGEWDVLIMLQEGSCCILWMHCTVVISFNYTYNHRIMQTFMQKWRLFPATYTVLSVIFIACHSHVLTPTESAKKPWGLARFQTEYEQSCSLFVTFERLDLFSHNRPRSSSSRRRSTFELKHARYSMHI